MGAEIAVPLTAALERINALTSTGRIDKKGLRSLREEVEAARQIGMIGQQLASLRLGPAAPDATRSCSSPTCWTARSRTALARDADARGINVKPTLQPARRDRRRLAAVQPVNTTLDWGAGQCPIADRFRDRDEDLPAHALLTCRFARIRPSTTSPTAPARSRRSVSTRSAIG
jgi:hypothetical protein